MPEQLGCALPPALRTASRDSRQIGVVAENGKGITWLTTMPWPSLPSSSASDGTQCHRLQAVDPQAAAHAFEAGLAVVR